MYTLLKKQTNKQNKMCINYALYMKALSVFAFPEDILLLKMLHYLWHLLWCLMSFRKLIILFYFICIFIFTGTIHNLSIVTFQL